MSVDRRSPLRWLKRAVVLTGQDERLARVLEGAGLHRAADRLAPLPPSVVSVELPRAARGTVRRIRMDSHDGRDQVARALQAGGWHAFEPPLPSVVTAVLRRWPGVLLDVGANTGLYSLIAAASHDRVRAIAFEPVPEIAALLRANIDLNGMSDRITLEPVAIGDATGIAMLHLPPAQADGTIETSASLESDFKEEIDRVIEVPSSTLDDAWQRHGKPDVTMVKIDVEGAEARVLAGARSLVATCRPVLSVEVLDRIDPARIEALRRELDYRDISLSPKSVGVGRAEVEVIAEAPNHLLVPPERLEDVVADICEIGGLEVARLDRR